MHSSKSTTPRPDPAQPPGRTRGHDAPACLKGGPSYPLLLRPAIFCRRLSGRMSVQTSLIYARHAALAPCLPAFLPTQRRLPVRRPDRVLLFVIHDHVIDRRVFRIVRCHRLSPLGLTVRSGAPMETLSSAHRLTSLHTGHGIAPQNHRLGGTSIGKSCRSPHSFHDPMKLRRFG